MTLRLPDIYAQLGTPINRVLTISCVRSIGIYNHICSDFLKMNIKDLIDLLYLWQIIEVSVLLK